MTAHAVLVVEPDLLVRAPLAEYLRECGYHVFEAIDASEARQILSGNTRQIHVVLADTTASISDGFTLATWIYVNHPGTHVVLAGTVTSTVEKAGDLCEDGPSLTKPYDHKNVLNLIRRLIAARNRASQND